MQDSSNLVSRVADLAADVLAMAKTRLEMLSVELQRERDAVVLQLKLGMVSILAAGIAGISAVLWAALSLDPRPRAIALGTLTVVFVAISIASALAAKRALQRQKMLFDSVIQQLGRDRSTLHEATPAESSNELTDVEGEHESVSHAA
jgi:uncharacterized membrane protein YqjE